MNKKTLTTLEFDKIVTKLADNASSEIGKRYAMRIRPLTDIDRIRHELRRSNDAAVRIIKFGSVSFSGLYDIRPYKKRLEIGSVLNASELLHTANVLRITENTVSYDNQRNDEDADSLSEDFKDLTEIPDLRKSISSAIISDDEIADDASPTLSDIRQRLSGMDGRIHQKLNDIISSPSTRDCMQEAVVVQREGHFCVSVRAEYKNKIPGAVIDSSATGSTLFIEPISVLELSGEIRTLKRQEAEEIQRILSELSEKVAEHIDTITENFKILAGLDFVFAKGNLAVSMNAVLPGYNDDGILNLRGARHPLLNPSSVVPIDVRLGEDYHQLVITGPNTGGKTVTLKTIGILSLMGQAGLLIPAKDRSTLPLFTEIFADIGDEQSIEQSLSTFSSHMTNIVHILHQVKKSPSHTLVLFDELCSGTDPTEGAALATAILDMLRTMGVRTVATTHYSELKVYALSEELVENASCEFDVETLSPTYRLIVGIPGKSNAFAISRKLGLSEDVISDASARMSEESKSFEDLLVDLENKRLAIEKEHTAILNDREEISREKENIRRQRESIEGQRKDIIRKANEKASNILQDAKNSADSAIRNINKYGSANPDMSKMEKYRSNIGKKLSHARNASADNARNNPHSTVNPASLHIGDAVHVISLGIDGTVHSLPNAKGDLTVTMGIMRSKVNIKDIELKAEANPYNSGKKKGVSTGKFNKSASISAEIKLLGMTTDEAVNALDKYLDDARLSHLSSVRVVHGKGSGALRKAIHEYLRRQPVSDYHIAEYGEGDSGVTIVDL